MIIDYKFPVSGAYEFNLNVLDESNEPMCSDKCVIIAEMSPCEQITNEIDCKNSGCYWYDGSCHVNSVCSELETVIKEKNCRNNVVKNLGRLWNKKIIDLPKCDKIFNLSPCNYEIEPDCVERIDVSDLAKAGKMTEIENCKVMEKYYDCMGIKNPCDKILDLNNDGYVTSEDIAKLKSLTEDECYNLHTKYQICKSFPPEPPKPPPLVDVSGTVALLAGGSIISYFLYKILKKTK